MKSNVVEIAGDVFDFILNCWYVLTALLNAMGWALSLAQNSRNFWNELADLSRTWPVTQIHDLLPRFISVNAFHRYTVLDSGFFHERASFIVAAK
jgi:hypothetical protein